MRDTEEIILNIFKNNSSKELSAEFLVREIYPDEYSSIEKGLSSSERRVMNSAKSKKFQLHRKLLYYINKLVESRIIKVSKTAEKGEKYFVLNAEGEDVILEKGFKKIMISKPVISTRYMDQYAEKNVLKIYREESWITKLSSILLECPKNQDISTVYKNINECMSNVNDAIALNDFENILNTSSEKTLLEFLERICRDTERSDITISILMNICNVQHNIFPFLENYTRLAPKKVNIVFNVTNRDVQKNSKVIEYIIQRFSDSKIKINFKNNGLSHQPCFKGRAGMYTFDEEEWKTYAERFRGKTIGISCCQAQIAVNVNRFFEAYRTDSEFRHAVLDAAKTLLTATALQRRKSNEYFRDINSISDPSMFYKFNRCYIRFWNYDWHKNLPENNDIFELIKSSKEIVDRFCRSEETIFKSCGVPIRFRIAFSSAFRNFDERFMGERDYKKVTVTKAEDYYTGEIKEFISLREKMFDIFDGGDRFRVFRKNEFAVSEILHELSILLSAYKLPFFTYDFSGLKGTVKLTNFM